MEPSMPINKLPNFHYLKSVWFVILQTLKLIRSSHLCVNVCLDDVNMMRKGIHFTQWVTSSLLIEFNSPGILLTELLWIKLISAVLYSVGVQRYIRTSLNLEKLTMSYPALVAHCGTHWRGINLLSTIHNDRRILSTSRAVLVWVY